MKLPIPFELNGEAVDDLIVAPPKAGALADVQRLFDDGRSYAAVSSLVASSLVGVEHPKIMVQAMPYRDAEYLALSAILMISPDDGFEGVYTCPRCGKVIIRELTPDDDTRDFVHELEIKYLDEPANIVMDLEDEVTFKSGGELIEAISSLEMTHPTMRHCEKAEQMVGSKETMRTQFALYGQALIAVNGIEVNKQWKGAFGAMTFERMGTRDIAKLSDLVGEYGMRRTIERTCLSCGKVWMAGVNTSGFFEFALRST